MAAIVELLRTNAIPIWGGIVGAALLYKAMARDNAPAKPKTTAPEPSGKKRRLSTAAPVKANAGVKGHENEIWGRYYVADLFWVVAVLGVLIFCPPLVIYYYISCEGYQCALFGPAEALYNGVPFSEAIWQYVPGPTWEATMVLGIWVLYQAALYLWLPGPKGKGQETPAGHVLEYNVNGLRTFILSTILYVVLSDPRFGINLFRPTIVYDLRGPMLIVANILGYSLAVFAYIKACFFPTHPDDVKFSGNFFYDFYMGAEMNPRIGDFDFKLFFNGRPGIGAWTIINISFMYAQYEKYGYVTSSLVLVTFLHFLYIIDFFYNEDWYLRTIDICHDHFGFYLAWGDPVWLPWMYTLQGYYLVHNPVQISNLHFALVLGLGFLGYYIFRATNNQKNDFRKANAKMNIWGKPATYIEAKYKTVDGKTHTSYLLTSGFWGLARHFNYLGDLALSFAYCAACGFDSLYPYFYIIFMIILLIQRTDRDNYRCKLKYGDKWDEYCAAVPYKIIPYVF